MQSGLFHCDLLVFLLYQNDCFEALSNFSDHCCFSVSFLGLGEGGEDFRGGGEGFCEGGEGFRDGDEDGLAGSSAFCFGSGLYEVISLVILFIQHGFVC